MWQLVPGFFVYTSTLGTHSLHTGYFYLGRSRTNIFYSFQFFFHDLFFFQCAISSAALHNLEFYTNKNRRVMAHGIGITNPGWRSVRLPPAVIDAFKADRNDMNWCLQTICADAMRSEASPPEGMFLSNVNFVWAYVDKDPDLRSSSAQYTQ